MKFSVEPWSTEYGSSWSGELPLSEPTAEVDVSIERAPSSWEPIEPRGLGRANCVAFVDGVRRVDARLWIEDGGRSYLGLAASYAAGAVRCEAKAEIVMPLYVERGLFTSAPTATTVHCSYGDYPFKGGSGDSLAELILSVQNEMGELEARAALGLEADLVVTDGPLTARRSIPSAVGYIKSHHVRYLPEKLERTVAELKPGQRTPLFRTLTGWPRDCFYLRLPGPVSHPWAGIVRLEMASRDPSSATRMADLLSLSLPPFASQAHKDSRAPQNLYPIAGLERELRRRLGDQALLERGLRQAAGS